MDGECDATVTGFALKTFTVRSTRRTTHAAPLRGVFHVGSKQAPSEKPGLALVNRVTGNSLIYGHRMVQRKTNDLGKFLTLSGRTGTVWTLDTHIAGLA